MTNIEAISGMPRRTVRSRRNHAGPLRRSDPGVNQPAMKNNVPMANI
jgi:hypothetical protein